MEPERKSIQKMEKHEKHDDDDDGGDDDDGNDGGGHTITPWRMRNGSKSR